MKDCVLMIKNLDTDSDRLDIDYLARVIKDEKAGKLIFCKNCSKVQRLT